MTTQIAEVAMGLSEVQREAILRAVPDGWLGNHFIRWWMANSKTMKALRRRGIGTTVWSGLVLTPLGLAVRQHLEEQS